MRSIVAIISLTLLLGLVPMVSAATSSNVSIADLILSNDSRSQSSVNNILQNVLLLKLDTLYSGRLKSNPKLAGAIKIKMSIDPDGSITDAKIITDTTGDKEFPRQVLNSVNTLTFDPGARDIDVSYTINCGAEKPPEPTGGPATGGKTGK